MEFAPDADLRITPYASEHLPLVSAAPAARKGFASKINDEVWVKAIKENQTRQLMKRFRKEFPNVAAALSVLDRVELMTPENIHVNAFMYEPIIDMSDDHLRSLFGDVSALA